VRNETSQRCLVGAAGENVGDLIVHPLRMFQTATPMIPSRGINGFYDSDLLIEDVLLE
jgi:hypothetical protein